MARRSVTRRPSPVRLIPYGGRTPAGVAVHGSLALALDSGPPSPGPAARPPLGLVRDGQPAGPAGLAGPTGSAGLAGSAGPAAEAALVTEARLIAQLVFDLLAGVRPYHHLAGYTTPQLFERLQPLGACLTGPAPRLGTVRVCVPRPEVAEVAAVARAGSRVRALALRLEHDRRWRCAAIETAVPG